VAEPKLELISFALCPYVQRARAILNEKQIEHSIKFIDLDNPPEWFFDVSPMEKVPVLLVDGKPLFESMVICEYLDETTEGSLHPADPFEKAQNRSWIEYGNSMLDATFKLFSTDDEKKFKHLTAELDENFDTLEDDCLTGGPFFNGETYSIIDAAYAPIFRYHHTLEKYYPFGFFSDRPKVTLWKDTLLKHKSVIESVPDTYLDDLDRFLRERDSIFSSKMK